MDYFIEEYVDIGGGLLAWQSPRDHRADKAFDTREEAEAMIRTLDGDAGFRIYEQPNPAKQAAARAREADQFVRDFHEWWTHTITVRPPDSLIDRARQYTEGK